MTKTVYVGTAENAELIWEALRNLGCSSVFVYTPPGKPSQVRVNIGHAPKAENYLVENKWTKPPRLASAPPIVWDPEFQETRR